MGKPLDLLNKKFGRLLVIEKTDKRRNGLIIWKCQCDCGNIIEVQGSSLTNGNTKSCGCLNIDKIKERNHSKTSIKIGNVYGLLTVIGDGEFREICGKQRHFSLCRCSCGNQLLVMDNQLQTGNKKSCGCLKSDGETIIMEILDDNDITYIKEYSFSDLIGKRGNKLRFDFAIFQDRNLLFLIEFDGRQHYEDKQGIWGEADPLADIQQRDLIKNLYCLQNNIVLKRIPYFKKGNISIETLLDDTFTIKER